MFINLIIFDFMFRSNNYFDWILINIKRHDISTAIS